MDDERSPGDRGAPPSPEAPRDRDLVLVHSQSETGVRVIRSRRGTLEVGEIRALREGQPISGEVVRLAPTDEERVFEVDVMVEAPPTRAKQGPAQVATAAYRAQWDAIFGEDTLN